jgi:hypothetical protein|tara:strand:- start:1011 stop:1250 length:240 start_codon:yes stop_codon:yes gene_type:complete
MNNEFITSLTITIIVFIIKFLEMRLILKENKGLKILFKESLIVFIASIISLFILNEFNVFNILSSGKCAPDVFVNQPNF